jgi:hypothetical protein
MTAPQKAAAAFYEAITAPQKAAADLSKAGYFLEKGKSS